MPSPAARTDGTAKRGSSDAQRYPNNVLEFRCVSNYGRIHPNQKPVELLSYLIRTYTGKGDSVLDFCMGSDSTGIACLETGRDFTGIEMDPVCFAAAKERARDDCPYEVEYNADGAKLVLREICEIAKKVCDNYERTADNRPYKKGETK